MNLKAAVKDWIPPILLRQLRKLRRTPSTPQIPRPVAPPEWEYIPEGWAAEREMIRGWDQPGVAETYAARWELFQRLIAGTSPVGVNYEGQRTPEVESIDAHNHVMTLAYVVGRAIQRRDRLSVLDYGGALGHHLSFLQALFPAFPFEYSCCELPHVATQGRRLHPQVHFFTDDRWSTQQFDLVFASNALQYAPQWQEKLAQLAGAATSFLLVTRLPVIQKAPSFVMLQRAEKFGYRTEYLGWCLNQAELLAAARGLGLILEREFLMGVYEPTVANAPANLRHRGFLFRQPGQAEPAPAG